MLSAAAARPAAAAATELPGTAGGLRVLLVLVRHGVSVPLCHYCCCYDCCCFYYLKNSDAVTVTATVTVGESRRDSDRTGVTVTIIIGCSDAHWHERPRRPGPGQCLPLADSE